MEEKKYSYVNRKNNLTYILLREMSETILHQPLIYKTRKIFASVKPWDLSHCLYFQHTYTSILTMQFISLSSTSVCFCQVASLSFDIYLIYLFRLLSNSHFLSPLWFSRNVHHEITKHIIQLINLHLVEVPEGLGLYTHTV